LVMCILLQGWSRMPKTDDSFRQFQSALHLISLSRDLSGYERHDQGPPRVPVPPFFSMRRPSRLPGTQGRGHSQVDRHDTSFPLRRCFSPNEHRRDHFARVVAGPVRFALQDECRVIVVQVAHHGAVGQGRVQGGGSDAAPENCRFSRMPASLMNS